MLSTGTPDWAPAVGGCLFVIALVLIIGGLGAILTMLIWNALLPDLFGWKEITFWQAWGINILLGIVGKACSYNHKSD